jgi:hypothetical protein
MLKPEYVAKQCAVFVKGPLAHIYDILINSGTFPEKFKVAKALVEKRRYL